MIEIRFPTSSLTSEYGDIILGSVIEKLSLEISYNETVILEEDYFPDDNGKVVIRDIGKVASMYFSNTDIDLVNRNGIVTFTIKLTENTAPVDVVIKDVVFYLSTIDYKGTINTDQLISMPLTRSPLKSTGPGRKEYISFFGNADVTVYAVYSDGNRDVSKTLSAFNTLVSVDSIYRIDVSPEVIAGLIGCPISNLVYYSVYTNANTIVKYVMDHRGFTSKTTFIFLNNFGATETITMIGHQVRDNSWNREFGVVYDKMLISSADKEDLITVNTGYLLPGMADVIDDLLSSKEVAVIDGDVIVPVVIIDEDFKRDTHKNAPKTYEITYRVASNTPYSKYVPLARLGVFDESFDNTFD
ncbi:MAG: hypothetical protein PHU68_01190 [Paludibacter sp.]|nr:hypothetical protein [Paludibacter sp.]